MQCEETLHLHSLNFSDLYPHAHSRAETPVQANLSLAPIMINLQCLHIFLTFVFFIVSCSINLILI